MHLHCLPKNNFMGTRYIDDPLPNILFNLMLFQCLHPLYGVTFLNLLEHSKVPEHFGHGDLQLVKRLDWKPQLK